MQVKIKSYKGTVFGEKTYAIVVSFGDEEILSVDSRGFLSIAQQEVFGSFENLVTKYVMPYITTRQHAREVLAVISQEDHLVLYNRLSNILGGINVLNRN